MGCQNRRNAEAQVPTLGLVAIGQTPRPDLEEAYRKYVPEARIRMMGALDGMEEKDIRTMAASSSGYPLSVMLRDRSRIEISLHALAPLVEKKLQELENEGVSLAVVLCCGEFPTVESTITVIYPSRVVPAVLGALHGVPRRIGIVLPNEGQIGPATEHWMRKGFMVHAVSAPPDEPDQIREAARTLSEHRPATLVLDCMGFGEKARQAARSAVFCPVIVPAFMTAQIASALVSGLR